MGIRLRCSVAVSTHALAQPCRCRTGGAGATSAAEGPAAFTQKYDIAKAIKESNDPRFAALRASAAVKRRETYVDPMVKDGRITFSVNELVSETPVAAFLAAQKGPFAPGVVEVPDVFKDKLDYHLDSWAKVEALNAGMLGTMKTFGLFEERTEMSRAATTTLIANYRAIADALTTMEALVAGQASIVAETRASLLEVSARLDAIMAAGALKTGFDATPELTRLGVTADHVAFLKIQLGLSGVAAPAFELVFQATVDGRSRADVMRKCKGKGPALVIGREATRGWLFGGYMDCGISDEGSHHAAPKSFVFSLTNPHGLAPTAWRRGSHAQGVFRNPSFALVWLGDTMMPKASRHCSGTQAPTRPTTRPGGPITTRCSRAPQSGQRPTSSSTACEASRQR